MLHSMGISSNRDRLEVVIFPAISGSKGYAALLNGGAEFDLDRIESTALDGGTDAI